MTEIEKQWILKSRKGKNCIHFQTVQNSYSIVSNLVSEILFGSEKYKVFNVKKKDMTDGI